MRDKVLIIDDDEHERARLAKWLTGKGAPRIYQAPPPLNFDVGALPANHWSAVVIDYNLSETPVKGGLVGYRGSTLAAVLREGYPTLPIILVTKKALVEEGTLKQARDAQSAFDDLWIKDEIRESPHEYRARLSSWIRGFRMLARQKSKSWDSLVSMLGAKEEEVRLLLGASPPGLTIAMADLGATVGAGVWHGGEWRVTEMARWSRWVLLEYPGVLYGSLHASAALGISERAFLMPEVQRFFVRAAYTGPFAGSVRYSWKGRLLSIARALLRRAGDADASLAAFGAAWRKCKGNTLAPARCNSSGRVPADALCYVMNEPVLRQFSLPYRPDGRPAVMDEARVSFKAIRTSNDFEEQLVPADARRLVRGIQKRKGSA